MIKNIGIENFRIFKNYTEFELSPITLLIGPNNSGKSSFLKLLNLLQYSFSSDSTMEWLNFDGGNNNLGTFDKVLNHDSNSKQIKVKIDFPLDFFDEKFQLELIFVPEGENGNLRSFKIFNKNRILLRLLISTLNHDLDIFNPSKYLDYYYIADLEYVKYSMNKNKEFKDNKNLFFNYYIEKDGENIELNNVYNDIFISFEKLFKNYYHPFDSLMGTENSSVLTGNIEFVLDTPIPNNFELFFDRYRLKNSEDRGDGFREIVNDYLKIEPTKKDMAKYREIFKKFQEDFPNIQVSRSQNIDEYILNNVNNRIKKVLYSFNKLYYLSVNRGSKERVLSNKSTNEIDEIVKEFYLKNYQYQHYLDFIQESFKYLSIEGELKIDRTEVVSTVIYLEQGDKKIPLSDLGFGYSQIIPIILKIINISSNIENNYFDHNPYNFSDIPIKDFKKYKKHKEEKEEKDNNFSSDFDIWDEMDYFEKSTNYPILIIEEPESNLHPDLQSKLVDILVLANKTFNVHFILETHSEYLVRKLQYLTAKKEISQKDVNIYYFNSDKYVKENEKKVKEIKINEFGGLTDTFGPGFFDKATQLQFELLKLNQSQNN